MRDLTAVGAPLSGFDRAAAGQLPEWARVCPERQAHIARVSALMERWACALGLPEEERRRWCAAAWLHDALRGADPDELRDQVPPECRTLPGPLLHGPAAAARLRAEGVVDESLLNAVAYHTLGHPALDEVGRALYLADFLEPGRTFLPVWRASLRARMPGAAPAVLRDVAAARLRHLLERGHPIRPETLAFWNTLAAER